MIKRINGLLLTILIASIFAMLIYQYLKPADFKEVPPPTALHPLVAEKKNELIALAADKGINVVITQDFRSIEEQDALYEKGRTAEGNIVTHAKGGESYHNFGLAIDFALMSVDGQVIWDMNYDGNGNSRADWMEVVKIAKDLGFEWGGDWTQFKDYPHLQMDFGLSIWELQRGKRPPEAER
ncbi:peptidase M15 [Cytobacillus firmus]|nr:peptidase M15 [Cytobacillus firmus]MBG9548431.1 peptidase M15 [Cytobacillus firmus]MBG9553835.1 peptidase M15 [Cytobacillus firmus]MBG9558753.1 peptidase M15 [Cytobacillus firmus]MBG9575829.1 peptidase M15 [Cytobacillus firmus]